MRKRLLWMFPGLISRHEASATNRKDWECSRSGVECSPMPFSRQEAQLFPEAYSVGKPNKPHWSK